MNHRTLSVSVGLLLLAGCNWLSLAKNALTYPTLKRGEASNIAAAAHPIVSLVAMVAPSPDWFTGVTNVNLMENGAWAASRTLDLIAYDSGGDDGTTYKAPDRDNNSKKPTSKASTAHFVVNGATMPVGSVTFTKK